MVVTMPDYFEALNRDFRYQLTGMGQFAQAIVGSKISGNSFTIKTDKPNVEVSWQVTGVRQDAWANTHRIPNEELKSKKERGHFLRCLDTKTNRALLPAACRVRRFSSSENRKM